MFGRGPLFPNFFGNDPILGHSNPFAEMDRMMDSFFTDPFFSMPHHPAFATRQPPQSHRQGTFHHLPGPHIEEVDEEDYESERFTSSQQPHVQEPDDGTHYEHQGNHRPRQPATPNSVYNPQNQVGSGGATYFSYSSTTRHSGPGGMTYSKSTTTRGDGRGVVESHETEHDGRTGQESVSYGRFLGDKGRTVKRTRTASGEERHYAQLHNVHQDQAHTFDQQWEAAVGGSQRPPQPQRRLPPNGSSAHRGPVIEVMDDDSDAGSDVAVMGERAGGTRLDDMHPLQRGARRV